MAKKFGIEDYKNKLKEIYHNDYTLISDDFVSTQSKVKIRCNKCNNIFEIIANDFTRNRNQERYKNGCKSCYNLHLKKDINRALEDLKEASKNNIELISPYINTRVKSLFKCKICNYEWETSIHTICSNSKKNKNNSHGCPKCSKKIKKDTRIFKEEVKKLVENEYEVLGEYIDTNSLILMKHNTCGNEYSVRPVDFLFKENRCPECSKKEKESRKSKYIRTILDYHLINYEEQKVFDNLVYKKQLKFDFFLKDLDIVLEFDGVQHFKNTFCCHEPDKFKEGQKRDSIKDNYILNNKEYTLVRIPYKCNYDDIKIIVESLLNNNFTEEIIYKYNLLCINNGFIYNENYYNLNK